MIPEETLIRMKEQEAISLPKLLAQTKELSRSTLANFLRVLEFRFRYLNFETIADVLREPCLVWNVDEIWLGRREGNDENHAEYRW